MNRCLFKEVSYLNPFMPKADPPSADRVESICVAETFRFPVGKWKAKAFLYILKAIPLFGGMSYNIKEIKSLNSCLAENNWAYSLLFYNRSKRDNLQKKGWK